MNKVNLIPATRLALKRRHRAIRRWLGISMSYAAVLMACAVAAYFAWGTTIIDTNEIRKVQSDASHSTVTLALIRGNTAESRRKLQSIQEISEQPDWSILLNAIGQRRGDDLFLTNFDLGSVRQANGDLTLHLSGVGKSQQAVSVFVLHLQEITVLEHVKLLQTNHVNVLGGDAFQFQVDCQIRGGGA